MQQFHRAPVLTLAMAGFLTQLDITAVVVAMPSIGQDFGFGIAGYAWVMDAYSLAFTATLLASGALADRYGRRRALLAGNALFALASLGCALAWNGPFLWAARAIQGVAAAFAITGSISLIAGRHSDAAQRARAFGLAGIVSGAAMAIGPTLGGAVAAWVGWRWIFFANLPACALTAWIVPRLVSEAHGPVGRPVDVAGIALATLALGTAIEGLLQQAHGQSVVFLASLAASALAVALFAVQQRMQQTPVIDFALFRRKEMMGVSILLITVSIAYWAVLVYLPLFLSSGFGFATESTGLFMLTASIPMLVLPPLAGSLVPHWGWRRLFAIGLSAIGGGNVLLALSSVSFVNLPPLPLAIAGMACIGGGAALVQAQLSGAVVALAPPAQAGMASALTIVMRQGGFAFGIAALGATLGLDVKSSTFALMFGISALSAMAGATAALALLPNSIPNLRSQRN